MPSLPDFLKVPSAVAVFRYAMAAKRSVLEPLFDRMQCEGPRYREKRAEIRSWTDSDALDVMTTTAGLQMLQEHKVHQAIYEDTGATILLLSAAEMERFYKETGISLYSRGPDSYVSGIKFAHAVSLVANQYKHLGEWRQSPNKESQMRKLVAKFAGNAFRTDAASEFLLRTGFTTYKVFQDALLSCSEGIVSSPIVVDGTSELPTVSLRG